MAMMDSLVLGVQTELNRSDQLPSVSQLLVKLQCSKAPPRVDFHSLMDFHLEQLFTLQCSMALWGLFPLQRLGSLFLGLPLAKEGGC